MPEYLQGSLPTPVLLLTPENILCLCYEDVDEEENILQVAITVIMITRTSL